MMCQVSMVIVLGGVGCSVVGRLGKFDSSLGLQVGVFLCSDCVGHGWRASICRN